jgi:DNA-binding CsgD family transcriptional regulator/tetratricopeptide (TPR) repeat protein
LVDAVVPGGLASLGLAEERGVLHVSPTRVGFRHELTRRAVADSLSVVRRVACNQAVLSALLAAHASRGVDLSRIVHHAAEVGHEATIVHYGPLAQQEAVAAGSHREAVAHGRLTLAHRSSFAPGDLVEILEQHAVECYASGLSGEALAAASEAVALRRELGDPHPLGVALRWLSRIAWWAGDGTLAVASGDEAVDVLSRAGDDHALAWAWSNRAQLLALSGRNTAAIDAGERAIAIARTLDDPALLSHALNNVGFAAWHISLPEGRARLEEALRVALEGREFEHACRAYVNLSWNLMYELKYVEAAELQEAGIALAEETEFVSFLRYLQVGRGIVDLARGAWDDALAQAAWGLNAPPMTRCPALIVTGLVRARRGQPDGDGLLAEAFAVAVGLGEAQRLAPAGAALLEAAWLSGSPAELTAAADQVLPSYDEVVRYGSMSESAALGYWLRVAGRDVSLLEGGNPYLLLASGRWREAAARWEQAGCSYERALALSHSTVADDLFMALSLVDNLGALPLGRILRDRLRDLGVARIPRGRAPSTRENPAGLTDRQVEVLRLLAVGLTNAEIASRLVLSVRTVDTHVAAILGKLEASTRRDAARRAAELGVIDSAQR